MIKGYKNFKFRHVEPPPGLFERIILAIKKEQELQKAGRLLKASLFLLILSLSFAPLSWKMLVFQAQNSGIIYFILTALYDFKIFITFWRDFCLAILESLPIAGIIFFAANLAIFFFAFRFILKKLSLHCLILNYGKGVK